MNIKLLSLYFLSIIFPLAKGQTWQQKAPLDLRYNATAFTIGPNGFVATGSTLSGVSTDVKAYNPQSNSWNTVAAFAGSARETAVSFSYQNHGFVGLGWNGSTTFTDFYKYDVILNAWSPVSSFPGYGGRNGVAASIGPKAYVSGGGFGLSTSISTELWEYDIVLDSWSQKASMPFTARLGSVAFASDSLFYFGLGHNFSRDFSDLWAYNPNTNLWTRMADFPGVGRLQVSVFEINGKFIVGGGHRYGGGLSSTLNDYYEYDPKTNSWTTVFGFSEGRRTRSEGFSINGKGYIVSGSNTSSAYINNLWEYSFPSSVSIEEISTSMINTSSVYPNPTSGELFILVNNKALINAVFMLYNSKGQLVLEKEFNHTDSAAGLNLQNLERSTYYYKLVTQEGQMSTGVIIKTD